MPGEDTSDSEGRVVVQSHFVRERNALVVRADFTPLYVDCFLHHMQHQLELRDDLGEVLKDALAAISLHLASRPRDEVTAWTVNFQEPLFNLFVTGDSRRQRVVGRVFTEDVRESDRNLLVSQVTDRHTPPRQSVIAFEGRSFFPVVESFFQQSEQRRARLFRGEDDEVVMVSAQPDCDLDWLNALDAEKIGKLDRNETLTCLEERHYGFACGCDVDRIHETLRGLSDGLIADLFAGDDAVTVHCPRCGALYRIAYDRLVAYLENRRED